MCGVVGIYDSDGRVRSQATLVAMLDAVRHRGPDDSGTFIAPGIALGHARLSVRDLSSHGHQPQADPSGRIVVSFNGEIYNDGELRAELSKEYGCRFRSTCDTEILPVGYLAWGDALFDKLEGMFAIALWDNAEQRLVLARDGIGIKPLFYAASGSTVRFASEIKGIFADPDQPKRLSPEGIHCFLAMGYVGPYASTYEGIKQVPPGTVLSFRGNSTTEQRFWKPKRRPEITSPQDARDEFLRLWKGIIPSYLISDVNIGVLLSGGIDSSIVALEANRSGRRTPLFTASFNDASFDETDIARTTARELGAAIHTVPVETQADLGETLRQVVHHYDGQVCDEASLALYLLSREVRRHVTVALSGDGGDEFFAGYPTYQASQWASKLAPLLPTGIWSLMGELAYRMPSSSAKRLPLAATASRFACGIATGAASAHAYWRRYVPHFMLARLYGPALRPLIDVDPFAGYRAELEGADGELIDRCLLADQRWHLPGGLLLKSDAMSMAHSLEVRVPLLDRRVMDFAGRCHPDLLLTQRGEKKAVLRAAARKLGAPAVVTEGAKKGFNVPVGRLLRGPLRTTADRIFDREADVLEPFLMVDEVRRIWREHVSGRRNHGYVLWPILNLAIARGHPRRPLV